jgi:endonuclease III
VSRRGGGRAALDVTDETPLARTRRARRIARVLAETYPDAHCELDFTTPLELLVATILSAQSTDARVNMVTPELFRRYPTAADYAGADRAELEEMIHSTGFFRAKTNSLIGLGQALVERYGGEVPGKLADLVTLPGVGRKTANVVLNMAFGEPTMAVDTHVFRVGNRTALAPGKNPLEVELALERAIPKEFMLHAHHWLILHGRYTCVARKPRCEVCIIADLCRWPEKRIANSE